MNTVELLTEFVDRYPEDNCQKENINSVAKVRRLKDGAIGYFKYSIGGLEYDGRTFNIYHCMELVYSRIGKLMNIPVVETSVEHYDGIRGLFSKIETYDESKLQAMVDITGKRNLDREDVIESLRTLSKDPRYLRTLLNQMVLDVICFQADRNTGNLMFTLNKKGKAVPYPLFDNEVCLTGVWRRFSFDVRDTLTPDMGMQFLVQYGLYYNLITVVDALYEIDPDFNWFTNNGINFNLDAKTLANCLEGLPPVITQSELEDIILVLGVQAKYLENLCKDSREIARMLN